MQPTNAHCCPKQFLHLYQYRPAVLLLPADMVLQRESFLQCLLQHALRCMVKHNIVCLYAELNLNPVHGFLHFHRWPEQMVLRPVQPD